ncbi:MAG: S41 family peptidase [Desulfosalsimonadaceae bacterium]
MALLHRKGTKSGVPALITAFIFILVSAASVCAEQTKSAETYQGLKLFSDVLEEIEKNYVEEVDTKELIEEAINGMVGSLDPHSSFLPPDAYKALQTETKGEFGGIGIVITKRDGRLTVISPIEGTPAYKAGVQAQDVIVKIEGKRTKDLKLWEAVDTMRGEAGSEVKISIYREGAPELLDFTLERAIIPMESVRYLTLKPGYGYLWVTNFRENTAADVEEALKDLEKENTDLKGLIVDLRDNPGGLLEQAVKVSDIFLEEGKIVSIKSRDRQETEDYSAHSGGAEHKYPVVVLINGGSASAAEIVAGALQDNARALILGTTSFGKGSVQTVKPLREGHALKYTIARYYTPSGRSIQAEGIAPDLVVQRRMLDKSSNKGIDANLLKEEDLENHLKRQGKIPEKFTEPPEDSGSGEDEAGGKQKKQQTSKKEAAEKLMRLRDAVYKHSDSDPRALLLDSQINRAYELLHGFQIFQGLSRN